MVAVIKKNKKKTLKKTGPAKKESKFISHALINKKKSKGKKKRRPKTKGLVYVKNLPHGFFEEQLRKYFSQFGAVTRIRLGRSPKTLNSRGYAFVEFRYPEVAQIAAETMNNYIMFHRIVKTKYIPPNEIHHDYFRSSIVSIKKNGESALTSKSVLARQAVVENTNKLMTDDDQKNRVSKVKSKVSKQKAKLAKLGIDFDVDEVARNMGEEIITAVKTKPSKKSATTIENLKDEELDDEADETFDPSKFDINSEDEFEDFAYESEGSESDDIVDETKKQKAINLAKSASKKYKETAVTDEKLEQPEEIGNKKSNKNKKVVQSEEEPAKRAKLTRKVAEKKEVPITKPEKKSKEIKKVDEKITTIGKNATKLKAKTQIETPVEKVVKKLKEKKILPKKSDAKEAPKKVGKVTTEKAKLKTTKESTKESPKIMKVSKASKKVKKVTASKK